MWGRRPGSVREVAVLVEVIASTGRRGLLEAMAKAPQFRHRWSEVLKDALFINRVGERSNNECTDTFVLAQHVTDPDVHDPALAAHIRDHAPDGEPYSGEFSMSDVIYSALALDDVSMVFQAQLFAQTGSRLFDAENPKHELAWRRTYSDIFERSYLNRRMECLSCHNSDFSVTATNDPATNRTWAVTPGLERAIYGDPAGQAQAQLTGLFRVKGVLSMEFNPDGPFLFWKYGPGLSPWGLSATCGQFVPRADVEPDPLEMPGYLVRDLGDTGSIWDIEELLRVGFAKLRQGGTSVLETASPDGEAALAWMVSMSLAEKVWSRITGRRLTAPHFFPRNRYQMEVLEHLTTTFVTSGFSLRALVLETLLHPYSNQAAPSECGHTPYYMSPLFDPWVIDHEVAEQRLNSPGDLVLRGDPRVLWQTTSVAMAWTVDAERIFDEEEGDDMGDDVGAPVGEDDGISHLMIDIGMFAMDGETGFRGSNMAESLAWEEAYGQCRDPYPLLDAESEVIERPDYVDWLLENAAGQPLETAIRALKDRLLQDPSLRPAEKNLMAALSGVGLQEPVGPDSEEPLRRICAALLASPQFLVLGTAPESRAGTEAPLVYPGTERTTYCAAMVALLGSGQCAADGHFTP